MSDYHWTAELARVRVPVLILQGLADQLTPPGGSVKMQRALPAARLLMFADTGHNLPLERAERFTAAVLGFTGGVEPLAAPRVSGETPIEALPSRSVSFSRYRMRRISLFAVAGLSLWLGVCHPPSAWATDVA